MKNFLFAVIVLEFTMTSCSSKQVTTENLLGSEWKLAEYTDNSGFSINTEENITISFRDSVMVTGNTGCNLFLGKYSLNESKIKIENIGSTKVFCGEDKAEMEQNYLNALSLELNAEISSNGKELTLKNAENGVSIKYTKCDDIEIPQMQ